jgi:hypothetical protein
MRYDEAMKEPPKVDRAEFERIVGNLLAMSPKPRKESKTGQPKATGKIIPEPKTHPQAQK